MKLINMKTASKFIMHFVLAATALAATHTASAAPQNGNGIVFNGAGCPGTQFRFYTDGGNGPGSPCDGNPWGDQLVYARADGVTYGQCIHAGGNYGHNWTLDEIKHVSNSGWFTPFTACRMVNDGSPANAGY